jgi:hypothetical protein
MEQQSSNVVPLAQQIAELPPLALAFFGITLALIVGVRYLGIFNGRRSTPEESKAAAPVAAVIVDPSALNRLTASGEALNMTLIETNKLAREGNDIGRDRNEAADEMNRTAKHIATELDRIREELRIQRELRRDR